LDQIKTCGTHVEASTGRQETNPMPAPPSHHPPSAKGQASKATLCPFEFLKWIRKQPGALSSSLSLVADFPWDFQDGA